MTNNGSSLNITHKRAKVNGVRLDYITAGEGLTVRFPREWKLEFWFARAF
jgi:hypothetical protein